MTDPGRPRIFCRFTAKIYFRSGLTWTVVDGAPLRFPDIYEAAGEAIEEACFRRARETTGDDGPMSIDLRVHSFATECTE